MLKGEKILLRAPEPSDVDLLYSWENDNNIWQVSYNSAPVSRFALEQYVLNSHLDIYTTKQLRLMIDNVHDGQTIGSVDLFEFDPEHRRAGIGIYLLDNERQKGKASEALGLMIDYCFDKLSLKQVFCSIAPDNQASIALFTAKGFQHTGTKKSWLFINKKWTDVCFYQLINHEYGQL
ncbi:MAG: N-acetyltransferase [Sphingobacteriia bacterium]|nr:N-acetyltransferase [Sphingobacteriia bacterium]